MFFMAWSREVAYHSNRNENKKRRMASHQAEPQQHISPTKVPRSCNFSGIPEAGRVTARLVIVWLRISGGERKKTYRAKRATREEPSKCSRMQICHWTEGAREAVRAGISQHSIAASHSIDLQKSLAIVDKIR